MAAGRGRVGAGTGPRLGSRCHAWDHPHRPRCTEPGGGRDAAPPPGTSSRVGVLGRAIPGATVQTRRARLPFTRGGVVRSATCAGEEAAVGQSDPPQPSPARGRSALPRCCQYGGYVRRPFRLPIGADRHVRRGLPRQRRTDRPDHHVHPHRYRTERDTPFASLPAGWRGIDGSAIRLAGRRRSVLSPCQRQDCTDI